MKLLFIQVLKKMVYNLKFHQVFTTFSRIGVKIEIPNKV